MGRYVDEKIAKAAMLIGVCIGVTTPSRETKWGWWEVWATPTDLVACNMFDDNVVCGEIIEQSELHMYVDDITEARTRLTELGH